MTAPVSIDAFASAVDLMAALESRELSSTELTEMLIGRIERLNPPLNAIILPTFERARASAREADERRERGERGALLGLPLTIKESNEVAGLPCTAGIADFKGYVPEADGPVPAKVFAAGGVMLGKTNIPVSLSDWQANSPIYGRTNNPFDLTRTPGGSTGGGSAALAAGLTSLEFGSDIGGSVRVPATFCGVYGHRPSETAVSRAGSFPMASAPSVTAVMGVCGPLARSAGDLELALDVMAGPEPGEDAGWTLTIPQARREGLAGLRVAVLPAVDWLPVDSEIRAAQDELAGWLGAQGAVVNEASPPFDFAEYYQDYWRCLIARTSAAQPAEVRRASALAIRGSGDPALAGSADGFVMDTADFMALMGRREQGRIAWRAFFRDWDVLLTPMTLTAAFKHTEEPFNARTIDVDGQAVPYRLQVAYPSLATFAGQPATAFPVGLNRAGLPIGLQAIGPYLEDRTPIRFAQLIERERGGFLRPPGF